MNTSIYEMTADLNVLEHLGINLCSNIAVVLTEVAANTLDADTSGVQIRVNANNEWIEIEDDGISMSIGGLNGKYLRVGQRISKIASHSTSSKRSWTGFEVAKV